METAILSYYSMGAAYSAVTESGRYPTALAQLVSNWSP